MLYPQIVSFYQGDLEKEKLKSLLKVSGVMINNRATKFIMPMAFSPMGGPECPHKKEKKIIMPMAFSLMGGPECPHKKKKLGILLLNIIFYALTLSDDLSLKTHPFRDRSFKYNSENSLKGIISTRLFISGFIISINPYSYIQLPNLLILLTIDT